MGARLELLRVCISVHRIITASCFLAVLLSLLPPLHHQPTQQKPRTWLGHECILQKLLLSQKMGLALMRGSAFLLRSHVLVPVPFRSAAEFNPASMSAFPAASSKGSYGCAECAVPCWEHASIFFPFLGFCKSSETSSLAIPICKVQHLLKKKKKKRPAGCV